MLTVEFSRKHFYPTGNKRGWSAYSTNWLLTWRELIGAIDLHVYEELQKYMYQEEGFSYSSRHTGDKVPTYIWLSVKV